VTTPLDRLSPRSVLSELRSASWEGPVGWPVLLIPTPWLMANQLFYAGQNGLLAGPAVGLSALALSAHLVVSAVLLWAVVPLVQKLFSLRSVLGLQLVLFTFGGVARATVMVLGTSASEPFCSRWGLLSLSWALNTGIWMTASAILVGWWHQVRDQRMELEAEYERQVLTRGKDARALAEADQQLATVRKRTHAAVAEIRSRLDTELVGADLDACIAVIDEVVAGQVRPTSHDLARMAIEVEEIRAEPLWRGWRDLIPAVIRSWPVARPFQPGLIGLLCLPMVMVAELVPEPHRYDRGSLFSMGILVIHLLLLLLADRLLGPQVAKIPPRAGVSVVFAIYVVMYLLGLTTLMLASRIGSPTPLEAFLVPPLLSMISGGISAFAKIRTEESAAARALIRRTNWEVRRTRQRLWAQRRRLAMALHGRVQANLTAASLMLGLARGQVEAGGSLDQAVVDRVRSTLALADLIDLSPADTPAVRLDTVAQVWEGVLSVSLDLRPGGLKLLEAGRDLTDACVEVVREILLNSVRHSGATHVEVVIGADQESLLCIRVTESSAARTPLGGIGGPGLGRTLIDSLAVDWAESDGEQGRVTVAMLAAGTATTASTDARSRVGDISRLT
jgi:signal transduction histidine kinase